MCVTDIYALESELKLSKDRRTRKENGLVDLGDSAPLDFNSGRCLSSLSSHSLQATSSLDPRILFRQWSDKFKKTYQAAGEFERRLEIFADNLAFALKVNAQDLGYT